MAVTADSCSCEMDPDLINLEPSAKKKKKEEGCVQYILTLELINECAIL